MEKQEQMTPEQRIKRLEQEIAILKKIAELALLLGVNLDTNSSGRFTEQQHYTAEVALNEILEIDPEKTRRIREFRPVYNRSYEPLPKGTDKTIEALLKSFGFEYPEINASQSSSIPMPQKAQ